MAVMSKDIIVPDQMLINGIITLIAGAHDITVHTIIRPEIIVLVGTHRLIQDIKVIGIGGKEVL